MTIDIAATAQNIQRLRKAAGLSVRELQDVFGFATPQAIYKWQNGESLPTLEHLLVLSRLFGVPMDDMIAVRHSEGE